MSDAIDRAAGLTPDDALYHTRRVRPVFVDGAEQCRQSVLLPQDGLGLSAGLRLALARRIALLNADAVLAADFEQQLNAQQPDAALLALAAGETPADARLAALARHADWVTQTPARAQASDITRLQEAGLSTPQIVAVSELIAFVNFQTRVAAGLRLMRS